MKTMIICVLSVICIVQAARLCHIRKQLSEWLDYLKKIRTSPAQKYFTGGNKILAQINYEINEILDENRKQLINLKKAETANRQILTNLSHDVRTPLTSLTGYLEALAQNRTAENEIEEYIRIAYQKALNLKDLIANLFEWFKINSHEQEYQIKEYDINELTRQILIGFLPVTEQKNIGLDIQIPDGDFFLPVDKNAYERIINNLLDNFIKHSECTRITVKIQKSEDEMLIELTNNGKQIPEKELPYLFDRLYQCDTARPQNGTGLGLTIVKELATAMNGKITVQSLSEETAFLLSFPLNVRKK